MITTTCIALHRSPSALSVLLLHLLAISSTSEALLGFGGPKGTLKDSSDPSQCWVRVRYGTDPNVEGECAGHLVKLGKREFLITGAHCFFKNERIDKQKVLPTPSRSAVADVDAAKHASDSDADANNAGDNADGTGAEQKPTGEQDTDDSTDPVTEERRVTADKLLDPEALAKDANNKDKPDADATKDKPAEANPEKPTDPNNKDNKPADATVQTGEQAPESSNPTRRRRRKRGFGLGKLKKLNPFSKKKEDPPPPPPQNNPPAADSPPAADNPPPPPPPKKKGFLSKLIPGKKKKEDPPAPAADSPPAPDDSKKKKGGFLGLFGGKKKNDPVPPATDPAGAAAPPKKGGFLSKLPNPFGFLKKKLGKWKPASDAEFPRKKFVGMVYIMCAVEEGMFSRQLKIVSTASNDAVIIHPMYNPENEFDTTDLAVIPITSGCKKVNSKATKPWVFLPFPDSMPGIPAVNSPCQVVGWSRIPGNKKADTSIAFNAKIYANPSQCNDVYGPKAPNTENRPVPFCTQMELKKNPIGGGRCLGNNCDFATSPLILCPRDTKSKNYAIVGIGRQSKQGVPMDMHVHFGQPQIWNFIENVVKFSPPEVACEVHMTDRV